MNTHPSPRPVISSGITNMTDQRSKYTFFFRNLLKGFIWLAFIIALFVFAKHNIDKELLLRFEPFLSETVLIIMVFVVSEIVFGIIPPELFMLWALRTGQLSGYIGYVALFAILSYMAGILGYLFGRYLNTTRLYQYLRKRFLSRTEMLLQVYGLYLILVAAITPVPFSAVAMLVGAVKYPGKNYAWWSLSRFIRFTVYAWIIWEANML
ncbi:MAG: VTT domain-containing protein [Bacteroidales bacterium]|nr:VTT domain-containing protein [Bacteroidales bacterium]